MEEVCEGLECFFLRERVAELVGEEAEFVHGVQDAQQVCLGALGFLEIDRAFRRHGSIVAGSRDFLYVVGCGVNFGHRDLATIRIVDYSSVKDFHSSICFEGSFPDMS